MVSESVSLPVADFDPLIITSPTPRSGTTLLQRLFCSSENALIYGEFCAAEIEFCLKLYQSKAMVVLHNRPEFERIRAKVQRGDVQDWILNLMPDVHRYLDSYRKTCLAWLAAFPADALEQGRPIWGFKYPGWPPSMVDLVRRVMPRSRWVCIYRDLRPCLQSAKAQQLVRVPEQVTEFCRNWSANLAYLRTLREDPAVCLVNFHELVNDPARSVERLAAFSGARGMRLDVFAQKINVWTYGDAARGYTPPAELTAEEERIVAATVPQVGRALIG